MLSVATSMLYVAKRTHTNRDCFVKGDVYADVIDDALQLTLRYIEKQSGVVVEHSFVLSKVDSSRQEDASRTLLSDLHEVTRRDEDKCVFMYACIFWRQTERKLCAKLSA